ncbi:hypothetical protein [Oricola cellulosilytica]|uniref:Uncharacterized protein n=1 Tax=Oricola cellulosilytica TaxID=1429082 RepID=A0A4R0P8G1_9HYPH|nr:hypothetical protein [Oricola cellulosilytica]TCD13354.1 hypothetical protein E0D97_12755 [Oricola cellulosilytica]
MSAHVDNLATEAARHVAETRRLSEIGSTTEETFYLAARDLLSAILRTQNLPFEIRTGKSESKEGGTDRPDFILADSGLFVGVFGEIKTPDATLEDIAVTTERNDQIGCYLSRPGVVLVNNVREQARQFRRTSAISSRRWICGAMRLEKTPSSMLTRRRKPTSSSS